jgi:hypothetical protein
MNVKARPIADPEPADDRSSRGIRGAGLGSERRLGQGRARARSRIVCLLGLLSLVACKPLPDKPAVSKFYPVGGSGFHYEAWASAAHPDYSARAEAARMRQLGVYLGDDHLCPKGYTITGRRIVGVNGNFALVSYDGVCN